MITDYDSYETVVGLEVHAQLLTQTKLFSGDSAAFGDNPNTQVSPISLGHPGTLPKLNKKAVEYAVKMGIACHCEIEKHNYFARKNYFYPDLPKGYQVSQHIASICKGGFIKIKTGDRERDVALNRIHLEEDAGKSLHDLDDANTCLDFNRAGVPLIEIVTEPDLHSSEEAYVFLTELRKLLRYLEICDGNMEEGSLRCDANVSVRRKGEVLLGTKVEVKNLNSIRNVKRAIDHEARRMIGMLENGEIIVQQTRSFDTERGTTFALRSKEEANDYRYFADPDLPPFEIADELIEVIRRNIPALPAERMGKYIRQLRLSEYDARVICDDRETADYFEALTAKTDNYKAASNWVLGPVKSFLNENNLSMRSFPVAPETMAELIRLVDENKVSFSVASSRIFPELLNKGHAGPEELAREMNLLQSADTGEMLRWVEQALASMPDKVNEYKKGKKGLIGLFMGEVKKISQGKADPKITNQLLLQKLEGS